MRLAIDKSFPRAASGVVKNMKLDMTDQEICERYCSSALTVLDADLLGIDEERVKHLRRDVRRVVFNLGFRRSSSIERELNVILSARAGDAVGVGEVATNKPPRRQRIRRKRLLNDDFIMSTEEVNLSLPSTAKTLSEMVCVAGKVPSELSDLEDEVAFLVEESLILLPDKMLASTPDNIPQKTITSVVSAGLSTQHDDDINWNYVCTNASEQLKQFLGKVGIKRKRRPIQRIIRYHDVEVRIAFERRRVTICELLVLDGYRREHTTANLPSNDLLEQVGLLNVMKVRLKYRLRSCGSSQRIASKKDLRLACNIRIKRQRIQAKKTPSIALDFTKVDPERYSVLDATEHELAFLREEFEMEHEHSCFDWDYIEKGSSRGLKQIMGEKEVTPLSKYPSVAGVSKLKKLVRLDSGEVTQAFAALRRDIRYALVVGFKRDLRRSYLPDLPPAPFNYVSRGKDVIDVQQPRRIAGTITSWSTNSTNLLCGEWKVEEEWSFAYGLLGERNNGKLCSICNSDDDIVNHQKDTETLRKNTAVMLPKMIKAT